MKNDKSNKNVKPKKATGRPKKYDDVLLKNIVDKYVKEHSNDISLLKPSKISKFANDKLGLKTTYQNFTRSKGVSEYIESVNKTYENLQREICVGGDDEGDYIIPKYISPIYERVNPEQLIKNSKNSKELEKNIELLNQNNERICEEYSKLKYKNILQSQHIKEQNEEIKMLKKEISKQENNKEKIKKLKDELKKEKQKSRYMARRFAIYDEFMTNYHYDSLKEFVLYLDNQISNSKTITIKESIFDVDQYNSGSYKLSDALERLDGLLSNVEYTEEYIYNSYDTQSNDDTDENIDLDYEIKSNPIDLDIEDDKDIELDFSGTVSKLTRFVKKK